MFYPVFLIRDNLVQTRILGSAHWITDPDPDPALFVRDFQDSKKVLCKFFCVYYFL
jgi:hypothetical protein